MRKTELHIRDTTTTHALALYSLDMYKTGLSLARRGLGNSNRQQSMSQIRETIVQQRIL